MLESQTTAWQLPVGVENMSEAENENALILQWSEIHTSMAGLVVPDLF